jgi:hypothetical protein
MKQSDSIIELAKALALFHIKVGKIKKDAKNPFFKSNYASLSNILTEVQDPLNESGLVITQFPDEQGLVSMLIHAESGQYLSSNYQMPVSKPNDPQALGSSITYARRYAISSILSLNVEDDDGNKGAEKPKDETDARPWLNKGEKLDAAIQYLISGGNIAKIEESYKISKEVRESLNQTINKL